MELFFVIVLGLVFGSFLNVAVLRCAGGESAAKGRSKCPKCGKTLKWYELIPLFSFAIQGGKCRGCKEKISWQYPLAEIFTAGVFACLWQFYLVLQWQNFSNNFLFFVFAIILFCLAGAFTAILIYDIKFLEIPASFLAWALAFVFILDVVKDINEFLLGNNVFSGSFRQIIANSSLASGAAGALAAGIIFFSLVFFSKEKWMGQGDVYVGAATGMLLGWPRVFESLLLAFTSGAIIGIILILIGGKKLSSKIAFGPFLILAGLAAFVWGEKILYWYIGLLMRYL